MEVQVPTVVEEISSKPLTRKERQVKKIKETMIKENRIYWDNIDESTAELCKFMKSFVDAHPRVMALDAEDAKNRFFECVAQAQYKEIRKSKLVKPVKPKQAKPVKEVKPMPEKLVKTKAVKPVKILKPKLVKPKPVKVVKPKAVKPLQISRAEKAYNLLYQEFLSLTDQEIAAAFVLNQHTSHQEPKPEYWCTICKTKFSKRSGLNRHFKRHMSETSPESSAITEASLSPDESMPTTLMEYSSSPDAVMSSFLIEDSDEESMQ